VAEQFGAIRDIVPNDETGTSPADDGFGEQYNRPLIVKL
jgi:hypothetical protein